MTENRSVVTGDGRKGGVRRENYKDNFIRVMAVLTALTVVMISWVCTYVNAYQTIHSKYTMFIVYQLCPKKMFKNYQGQEMFFGVELGVVHS